MNLYTHVALARLSEKLIQPAQSAEYIWGAVAPDVRYVGNMRREQTHLPDERIANWLTYYPGQESFIQGYRVHCLLDQIDPVKALLSGFPLKLARKPLLKRLNGRQAAVAIELYYHRRYPLGLKFTGSHNVVLTTLGVQPEQSERYARELAAYFAAPSVESAMRAFSNLGLIEDARVEKYAAEYQRLIKNPVLLNLLMASIGNARLDEVARRMVKTQNAIAPFNRG